MNTKEKVKEVIKKLPLAPAGIHDWIRKEVIKKSYIIYNKKEDKAVCTRCGRRYKMKRFPDASHGLRCQCPGCKADGFYKAAHYGRKKLTEQFRILIFTHRGKTVYGTLWEIDAEFKNVGVPTIYKWLSALYVFDEDKQRYFKHSPGGYWNGEHWEEPKECTLPHHPSGYNYWTWAKYERTELYTDNLKNVFTKSCLKYLWMPEMFQECKFDAYDFTGYIAQGLKYKSIELLAKAGFERIVTQRVNGRTSRAVNWRGKELTKILKLPKRWIKKVREEEMGMTELQFFQTLTEKEKALPQEIIKLAMANGLYRVQLEKYVPYMDAAKYVYNQQPSRNMCIYDYRDYLKTCDKMGMDMSRKKVLFPENLETVHDEVTKKYRIQKDECINRKIKEQTTKIIEMDRPYRYGGLMIFPAMSQEDLNQESKALNHCVRTYGERIADGDCVILFIRKEDAPDKPYYTLELSPKKEFRQCRGERNCNMTKEVEAFVEKWLKEIQKKSKEKKKEAA